MAPTDRNAPVNVIGLDHDTIEVAPSDGNHMCARHGSLGVLCWGDGRYGQLGDGTWIAHTIPAPVIGLAAPPVMVDTGTDSSCAVVATGNVQCWGDNTHGRLGDGTTLSRNQPVTVTGLTKAITAVAMGSEHVCALSIDGHVFCWGHNSSGQLGDGTLDSRATAAEVPNLGPGITGITSGRYHTCALLADGGAKCWGQNNNGQLGDGTEITRTVPIDVVALGGKVLEIDAGAYHTCVRLLNGNMQCWGDNATGQLGDGTLQSRAIPAYVEGISDVTGISTGMLHTCAVRATGDVYCWGYNMFGELGNGTGLDFVPQTVMVACYGLNVGHTGAGQDPTYDPAKTASCPDASFVPGQVVTLVAQPAMGWSVNGWSGTDNDAESGLQNTVTMTSADRTVAVDYRAVCYRMTANYS
ncbi:MAG: hypothetical protein IPK16_28595, partial [Anaerolineales bacterium]|nr:hypothetical protein [Anaerolineales bacterium]